MAIGFLDPEGLLHECVSYDHMSYAEKIAAKFGQILNGVDSEQYLMKLGWIVVRARDCYGLIGYLDNDNKLIHMTDAQADWLLKEYSAVNREKQESIDRLFDLDGRH